MPAKTWRMSGVMTFALAGAGCATMGQVANLDDASCAATFERHLASILVAQHESSEIAAQLSQRTRGGLELGRYGPRPFVVSSPSGADYYFFVEATQPACLLHLYGRQKGFATYTNNLTWIETRALPECGCTAE